MIHPVHEILLMKRSVVVQYDLAGERLIEDHCGNLMQNLCSQLISDHQSLLKEIIHGKISDSFQQQKVFENFFLQVLPWSLRYCSAKPDKVKKLNAYYTPQALKKESW